MLFEDDILYMKKIYILLKEVLCGDDWNIKPRNTSCAGIVLYDDCWCIKNGSYGMDLDNGDILKPAFDGKAMFLCDIIRTVARSYSFIFPCLLVVLVCRLLCRLYPIYYCAFA